MDKKLKTKWVKALRSGEYTQCDSFLHDGENYCCLGVLCLIAGRTVRAHENEPGDITVEHYDWVENKIGNYQHLVEMNDTGMSFKQIADYIEANL